MHQHCRNLLARSIQTTLCLLIFPNAYAVDEQATSTQESLSDKEQFHTAPIELQESEKKMLSPYLAEAVSDEAYLIKLTELINDDSKGTQISALKALSIQLPQDPELATSSAVST